LPSRDRDSNLGPPSYEAGTPTTQSQYSVEGAEGADENEESKRSEFSSYNDTVECKISCMTPGDMCLNVAGRACSAVCNIDFRTVFTLNTFAMKKYIHDFPSVTSHFSLLFCLILLEFEVVIVEWSAPQAAMVVWSPAPMFYL
jgi:hypothetical protein